MNGMFIMPLVPRPDVRRAKHGCGPIIRDSLVQSCLSIFLIAGTDRSICREICSVARYVMAVLVIDDSGVMCGVGSIAATNFCQRAVPDETPPRSEMDFSIGRDRFVFRDPEFSCRQTIVAA